ncbi:MAG: transglycosylase domain-containing protein, partial [Proteobacteria bacterium]|nr:transglycosylase domain-containing protein [Pseudomonadota bacterium]
MLIALLVGLTAAAILVTDEVVSSRLQARYISRYAATLDYGLVEGASDAIRFPTHGPFDRRMGYADLPVIAQRLTERGFAITQQVRFSDELMKYTGRGFFPPYREKTHAGLDLADCRGEPLYQFRYPYRHYDGFAAVPPLVGQALMFIENRDLLDESRPRLNPAVDWVRFSRAVLGQVGRMVNQDLDAPGGSTLATQIEKYRHSPDGVTYDAREKLRQMVSASVRAYRD